VWRTPLDLLVQLESAAAVAEATPAMDGLAALGARGVILTAPGGEGVDFTSRFFAPRIGIPEDSVTGSAHASLGPFWAERLGTTSLRARQASARGGYVDLRIDGDTAHVGGPAVTVSRGLLAV
jgi:predicted PhzF superfamily epimerase YddE/YHI9